MSHASRIQPIPSGAVVAVALLAFSAGPARSQVEPGAYPGIPFTGVGEVGPVVPGWPAWGAIGYGFPFTYGYGGWGWGGVLGWNIGMTYADQQMLRFQAHARNAAQTNLTNAQAAMAYQAAERSRQEALSTWLQNLRQAAGFAPRAAVSFGDDPADPAARRIPLSELVARDGRVLWPLGAPDDGEFGTNRAKADEAIRAVVVPFAAGERVPVRAVADARAALSAYAVPAAEWFRAEERDGYDDFVRFVESLDAGIREIDQVSAVAPRRDPSDTPREPVDIRPETAPRTGGDALREALLGEDRPAPERPAPDAPAAEPAAPPES